MINMLINSICGMSGEEGRFGADLALSEVNKKLYAYLSQVMGIKAYDIMEPPTTVGPEASVTEVAKLMDESGAGAVIIIDQERRVKGILTFRDVVTRVVARELDPSKVKAGDIMTENVYVAPADAPLDYIAGMMIKYGVRRIPILNKLGRLVGIVEAKDLIGFLGMQRDLMIKLLSNLESELSKHVEEASRKNDDEEGGMYV